MTPTTAPKTTEPSSTTTTVREAYITALTLNNIGVYLLERGAYVQAFRTFNDAVKIMKCIMSPGTCIASPSLRNMLVSGLERQHNLRPCVERMSIPAFDTLIFRETLEPGQRRRFVDAEHAMPLGYLRPVRIEPTVTTRTTTSDPDASCSGTRTRDANLDTVLMLNNFATCHYVLSTTKKEETASKLITSAQKLFDLALACITKHLENNNWNYMDADDFVVSDTTVEDETEQEEGMMCLCALLVVAGNSVQVHVETDTVTSSAGRNVTRLYTIVRGALRQEGSASEEILNLTMKGVHRAAPAA